MINAPDLPLPGHGATAERFRLLAALGREDLVAARLGEGHADAVAIRVELGDLEKPATPPGERWGVWAAAPSAVRAEHTTRGWRLTGDRPWCSGAAWCTDALVTAAADDGIRLFAVRNEPPRARPVDGTWPAIGMAGSDSRTIRFDAAPPRPVGDPGRYVDRPGFWHGGIGVAACWYGGALGVADRLLSATDPGPHGLAHLGAVDVALGAARAVLAEAAAEIDADPARTVHRLALRARATVEAAATQVLDHVGRALGAGPLCRDERHARRVADLTVYLRQSHAEKDLEQLGAAIVAQAREAGSPW
ncbi:acyl-CoA dehydrogenase [Actinoplanes sp. CA-054009]